jgi:hypothetical protein
MVSCALESVLLKLAYATQLDATPCIAQRSLLPLQCLSGFNSPSLNLAVLQPCLGSNDVEYLNQVWDLAPWCSPPDTVATGASVGQCFAGCFSRLIYTRDGDQLCLEGLTAYNARTRPCMDLQKEPRSKYQQWLVSSAGGDYVYLRNVSNQESM